MKSFLEGGELAAAQPYVAPVWEWMYRCPKHDVMWTLSYSSSCFMEGCDVEPVEERPRLAGR